MAEIPRKHLGKKGEKVDMKCHASLTTKRGWVTNFSGASIL
jgi:hypothetical protein